MRQHSSSVSTGEVGTATRLRMPSQCPTVSCTRANNAPLPNLELDDDIHGHSGGAGSTHTCHFFETDLVIGPESPRDEQGSLTVCLGAVTFLAVPVTSGVSI